MCRDEAGMHSSYFIVPDGKGYPGPGLHAVPTFPAMHPEGCGLREI